VKALFSSSVRGRAAVGGRGSLTQHLELGLGNLLPWLLPLTIFLHDADDLVTRLD
jgi:hypothetical protein